MCRSKVSVKRSVGAVRSAGYVGYRSCDTRRGAEIEEGVPARVRKEEFLQNVTDLCIGIADKYELRVESVTFERASKILDVRVAYADGRTNESSGDRDCPQSVSIEILEQVNKTLGDALDESDVMPASLGGYSIEVSTPGASDELLADWQFRVYKGFAVEVKTTEPFKKSTTLRGSLSNRTPDSVVLSQKGRPLKIPRSIVESVSLITALEEDLPT